MNVSFAAVAVAMLLGVGIYGWTRIRGANRRRDKQAADLAAKRARYARQTLRDPEPEIMIKQKPNFGRR